MSRSPNGAAESNRLGAACLPKFEFLEDFAPGWCYAVCRRIIRGNMPLPQDPLDPLLDSWKEPDLPQPSLAPEVWRRIELAEKARGGIWAGIDAWLSRPPFAVLFVVSCALLGLFMAEVRVNQEQRTHSAQLARSYLQLIDPLMKADAVTRLP
jgi:hypothetical protein